MKCITTVLRIITIGALCCSASVAFAGGGGGGNDDGGSGNQDRGRNYTSRTDAQTAGESYQNRNDYQNTRSYREVGFNFRDGFYRKDTYGYTNTYNSGNDDDDNRGGGTPGWTCVANSGQSCNSQANACGVSNSGTISCSGACIAAVPALPAGYGNSCGSGPNSCGMTHSGSIGCDGNCNVPTTPPSDDLCPLAGEIPQSSVPGGNSPSNPASLDNPTIAQNTTCVSSTGNACSYQNPSCNLINDGFIGCSGLCQALTPEAGICSDPGTRITCQSGPNTCGQVNSIEINGYSDDDCPVVTPPSDSSCGIPTLGLRPKDGKTVVQEGGSKILVWDNIKHATECVLTGGGLNVSIVNFTQDQTQVPWVNVIPSGEQASNSINVATAFTLVCRNGSGPWVSDSVRIVPLPEIIEN